MQSSPHDIQHTESMMLTVITRVFSRNEQETELDLHDCTSAVSQLMRNPFTFQL